MRKEFCATPFIIWKEGFVKHICRSNCKAKSYKGLSIQFNMWIVNIIQPYSQNRPDLLISNNKLHTRDNVESWFPWSKHFLSSPITKDFLTYQGSWSTDGSVWSPGTQGSWTTCPSPRQIIYVFCDGILIVPLNIVTAPTQPQHELGVSR